MTITIGADSQTDFSPSRRPRLEPAKLAKAGDRRWFSPGSAVTVAATLIADGMVYVGPDLPPIGGWQDHEPALIDPTLNVSRGRIDQASENLGYWPSYGRISPESRAAYLEWLAGGRCDPDADIGYVFLFFYGLERRLLFDLRHLPERRSEAPSLIAEVARLRSLYGANGSFASYSSSLLQIAQSLWSDGRACERPPSFDRPGSELPADVRLAVGQLVAAGEPIPADWALAWVTGHPETRLRTPARRCPEEFRHLFCHRYREKFGQGMLLKPNKRRLKISHRPASASFGDEVEVPFEHIPDIAALKVPIRPLQEIAEAAMSELDAYSRLVGRSPEKARTLEGRALLPPELAEVRKSPASERLQRWVEASLGDGDGAAVPASDLMAHWDCARADRMSKRELGSFARALESLGFGIEPDPRFGGGSIREGQKVVLFPLGSERIAAASPAYRASTLLLHLAALVAASDGSVGDAEERHLEEQLERSMSLDPDEVRRLRAHLMWLLVEQPSAAGIKSRLEGVDSASRRLLAEFAMATAAADGVIDRGEIRTLTKIYGLLGFDPDQAYGDVHSLQVSDSWRPAEGPLRVRPQVVGPSGRAIPEPPSAESVPPSGFKLDMDRVQRTLAETVAISQVLAEVFEDEPAEAGRGELAPVTSNTVAGLDARHAALLLALDGRSELSSAEFEELAESFDLLADGAREMLNEAAFERADNALLEGEDPVEVNLDVLSELQT